MQLDYNKIFSILKLKNIVKSFQTPFIKAILKDLLKATIKA